VLLLSQSSPIPTPQQAQLSARIANDILETMVKIQTTFRQVLEDSQSEQEEWVQTICATFACIVLTINDIRTVNFEPIFLEFFGEPAFFKVVVDMIGQDEQRINQGSLLFAAGLYLQMNKGHPDLHRIASAL
jgi:hypothetical protein